MKLDRLQKSSIFFLAFSGAVIVASVHASLGSFSSPGPGLLPCLAAALLGFFSLINLFSPILSRRRREERVVFSASDVSSRKLILTLAALFAFPLALKGFGFGFAMFAFVLFMTKIIGARTWPSALIFSFSSTVISYLLFVYWLKFFVDKGILGLY